MTREELKEHCKKEIEMCEFWAIGKGEKPSGKVYEEHKLILELLEQEPRWIPVKDRLPQKGEYGDVLVTFVPTAGTLWATVMIAHYSDLMGIAKPCFHIGEVGKESFEDITPQVTAWMPLPKPYKESESEVLEDGNIKNS